MCQDIILVSDYHDAHCVIRTVDRATGSQAVRKVATAEQTLNAVIDDAARVARERGGRLVWLQESTTGCARMKAFVGDRAEFLLANVLQMPAGWHCHLMVNSVCHWRPGQWGLGYMGWVAVGG